MIHKISLPAILLACLLAAGANADDEITPTRKTSGTLANAQLISVRPKSGIISDSIALKKLWTAWRPNEDVPDIDFKTQIVLVETAPGPNTVMTGDLVINPAGSLEYAVGSTRKAGAGFGYLILMIPKKGIVSVNGVQISPPSAAMAIPEGIKVDIIGKIQTGLVAIGGETTGTTISCNGIVWELDLGSDRNLQQSARLFHSSTARVQGSLTRISGVEIGTRWIVQVQQIGAPGSRPQSSDNKLATSDGEPDRLMPSNKTEAIEISTIEKSYKTISIVTTGGPANERQTLSISAEGAVRNEIKSRGISASWTISPAKLQKLHQFIDQTDWSGMRRLPRSDEPDVFRYEISIERKAGLTRILVDSVSIADQPTIQFFFQFFRRTTN